MQPPVAGIVGSLASVPSLPSAPSELGGCSRPVCPDSQPWALGPLQVLGPASPLQGRDCPLGSLGLCLLTLASGPLVTRLETLQPAGTSAVSIVCPFAHPHLSHTLPVLASHLELAVLLSPFLQSWLLRVGGPRGCQTCAWPWVEE